MVCKNEKYLTPENVKVHLYKKGFKHGYWYWTSHGEVEPQESSGRNMHHGSSSCPHFSGDDFVARYQTLIDDVGMSSYENGNQPPNVDAQSFYNMINACQRSLWPGCNNHSELSASLRMMCIKADYNVSKLF